MSLEISTPTEISPDNIDVLPEQSRIKDMLEARWAEGKFLCVGLDVTGQEGTLELYEKAQLIVSATESVAAAYKPNSAFYESQGAEGFKQLEQLAVRMKIIAPNIPFLWDAKRADIAKTNEGYDHAANFLGADGITIHPYLGGTAVKPLLSDPDRMGIVLGHTSNPGAGEFQHLELKSGELLWERVVKNVAHSKDWQHGSPLGVVIGATYPEEVAKARHLVGDDVMLLIPGIGTQGGDLENSVRGAMNSRGNGFLINVSSGISKATDASGRVTFESVQDAAIKFHKQIRAVWQDSIQNPRPNYTEQMALEFNAKLAHALYDNDCLKFGEFKLRDGSLSPIYVDLRSSITDPKLRGMIAQKYVEMIEMLENKREKPFDLLGAIPEASISYGSIVAERMGRRLIQPRAKIKAHGRQKLVEGNFEDGETVGLIDDLITSGGAKIDVIAQIEKAGLKVGGLAVLVDREQGGFREMAARGRAIIAATTLKPLVTALSEQKISSEEKAKVLNYLSQTTR